MRRRICSALEKPIRPVRPTRMLHQPVLAAPLAYARPAPQHTAAAGAATAELAREFYIPAVVLVVGFGCILGWLAHHGRFVFAAVVIVMFLAGLLMIGRPSRVQSVRVVPGAEQRRELRASARHDPEDCRPVRGARCRHAVGDLRHGGHRRDHPPGGFYRVQP